MDSGLPDKRCRETIRENIWSASGIIVHLRRLSAKIVFFDLRLAVHTSDNAIGVAEEIVGLPGETLNAPNCSPSDFLIESNPTRLSAISSVLEPDGTSSTCSSRIIPEPHTTDLLTNPKIEVVLKASEYPNIKSLLRTLRIGAVVKVYGRQVEHLDETSRQHLLYHASDFMILRTAADTLADVSLDAILERPLKIDNGWGDVNSDLEDRRLPIQPIVKGYPLHGDTGQPTKCDGMSPTSADRTLQSQTDLTKGSNGCPKSHADRVTNEVHADFDAVIAEADWKGPSVATTDSKLASKSATRILPSGTPGPHRGICKFWINSRHCINREQCPFSHPMQSEDFKVAKVEWISGRVERRRVQLALANDPLDPHLKGKKGVRAACFADWLVKTFGAQRLCEGRGVLDVAGGKGSLAFALHSVQGISTTLIDPRPRKLTKMEHKHLQKNPGVSLCHTIQREFDAKELVWDPIIGCCSCLVGLHPDEATESIVVAAVKFRKPFAVVPCCVFPNLFPDRTIIENGVETQVQVYEQFIKYLAKLGSDGGGTVEIGWLNIEGRNQVLFCKSYDG